MVTIFHKVWEVLTHQSPTRMEQLNPVESAPFVDFPTVEIASDDILLQYFKSRPMVIETDRIELDSPGLAELKRIGVKLIAPLVLRGEVVGLLNLGPRLSSQEYSVEDYHLLNSLVTQAAPALRVAQLAELQKREALRVERLNQELRVARLIQQTLLPKEVPVLPGWNLATLYQPARAVGGDFYDFLKFEDGRIGLVIGDVTDKGMPAALLMATTRATLRVMAHRFISPGEVLRRTNEVLYPDVPPSMFITCLYVLLDPLTGHIVYANAGHNLPYLRGAKGTSELRATGMPLGLLPGMKYEEYETTLKPGISLFMYSDGLVEAHNPRRDMFGNPRLEAAIQNNHGSSQALIDGLLNQLSSFTGAGWEQEDDITIVILNREGAGQSI